MRVARAAAPIPARVTRRRRRRRLQTTTDDSGGAAARWRRRGGGRRSSRLQRSISRIAIRLTGRQDEAITPREPRQHYTDALIFLTRTEPDIKRQARKSCESTSLAARAKPRKEARLRQVAARGIMPSHDTNDPADTAAVRNETDNTDCAASSAQQGCPLSFSLPSNHSRQKQQRHVLHEAVCWRQLEGRNCFHASERGASSASVALVLLHPSRRDRDGQARASFHEELEQINTAIGQLHSDLASASIAAAVDADDKTSARAKWAAWEARGVPLRVEVGFREVLAELLCVWVHPAYAHLAPAALAAVSCELGGWPAGTRDPPKLANLRIRDCPSAAVAPLCRHLLAAIIEADGKAGGESVWGFPLLRSQTHRSEDIETRQGQLPSPSLRCTKLHLGGELAKVASSSVCLPHLRWLVGQGRPCHCTSEHHVSMADLRACVERELRRGGGAQSGLQWANDNRVRDPGGNAMVMVGNIPSHCHSKRLLAQLAAAFAPYNLVKVYGSKARREFSHGWARVVLPSLADAMTAVQNLDGTLEHLGNQLSVSMSAGRLDTLFPMFPYNVRCKLRVGAVAAFSVTDQTTADRITLITSTVAQELLLHNAAADAAPPAGDDDGRLAAAGPLLPLAVTDATACSGGNTLSLMARFADVHAVEMDEDRAADLRHNVDLVMPLLRFAPRVTTHHAEYLSMIGHLKQDIVVLDPPWGGPMYNSDGNLHDLYLSDTSVAAVAALLLREHAPVLVIRLPHVLSKGLFMESMAEAADRSAAPAAQSATQASSGCGPSHPAAHVLDVSLQMGRSILLILARCSGEERSGFERRVRLRLQECSKRHGLACSVGTWHTM
eukprot:jgi/Tetstr1/420823/TSEL_011899.t1